MVARKNYNHKHFITKLVYDILPLGNLLVKYDPTDSPKCPDCSFPMEDRVHFLTCPNRTQWQQALYKDLRDYMKKVKTRPMLEEILLDGLAAWFQDPTHPILSREYPLEYHNLLRHQQQVGWIQLFLGRFVVEWRELQSAYLRQLHNVEAKLSGVTWVVGIAHILWAHLFDLWEIRNSVKHGVDATSREAALAERARRETAALYDIRDNVLPRDRDLFYTTLEDHWAAESSSRGLRQWVNTWKPVILRSVKDNERQGTTNNTAITSFFTRVLPTRSRTEPAQRPHRPTTAPIQRLATHITDYFRRQSPAPTDRTDTSNNNTSTTAQHNIRPNLRTTTIGNYFTSRTTV